MSASKIPEVLLDSSSECIEELKIIEAALKPYAVVTPWMSLFEPGHFILESLLERVNAFDFAVFVFGPDDITISRDNHLPSPRDNVVFEAGLFMGCLGRERTLVVAPSGENTPIKILSDFMGLTLVNYDLPEDSGKMWQCLQPAADKLIRRITDKKLPPRSLLEVLVKPGPRDVTNAGQVIEDLIQGSLSEGRKATIRNIALDMEITWPMLKERILENKAVKNVTWQSLMIDSSSKDIQKVASRTVHPKSARKNQKDIRRSCERAKAEMEERQIEFECRAYKSIPAMHGFLINESIMLLTLCDLSPDGKLVGRPNPYWKFDRAAESETTAHFFKVFNDWFAYHWSKGRRVWSP